MKTYWLQGRECRTPVPRTHLTTMSTSKEVVRAVNSTTSTPGSLKDLGARTVVYSPITFQDVARRSIASSPVKTAISNRGRSAKQWKHSVQLRGGDNVALGSCQLLRAANQPKGAGEDRASQQGGESED
ncbi:hypothetical protein D910_02858 [Dendroctonus ponderosae]